MFKKYKTAIFMALGLLAIFQLYLFTTYPAFKNDDSPETAASIYTLGIGHPPSYPFFTMAGKIFSLLPLGAPAFRANLFSCFLALCILALSILIIKQNLLLIFKKTNPPYIAAGVVLLALSYIFWNQGIEAKGGIYMLNLLFFALIIYLVIKLYASYDIKYVYLISYFFGLSLSNHWPSTIIILPAFVYLLAEYRAKLNLSPALKITLLILLGLSAYIYLPIRAMNRDVFVFMARPDTRENFLWTVFRSGYSSAAAPSLSLYKYQVVEFLRAVFGNYGFLSLFAFIGGYALWKTHKKIFHFYIIAFLSISLTVVLANRTIEQAVWVIGVFLIPAQYIMLILIALGLAFTAKHINNRLLKAAYIAALLCAVLFCGFYNFAKNNSRQNYLSYDFGGNIIKTMGPGDFFLPESDYYVMSLCYFDLVLHGTGGIRYCSLFSLQNRYGMEDFSRKYGLALDPALGNRNVPGIINKFAADGVYLSYFAEPLETSLPGLRQKAKGILYKISGPDESVEQYVFKTYSYRGIYGDHDKYDLALIRLYSQRMAEAASELYRDGKKYESDGLYRQSQYFPQ